MRNFKNKPLITIITVVLNNKKKLDKALKSILSQSYKNIELIVIDGGSTDGTINTIKKYQKKINYWISEKYDGIYDAINKGINKSTGDIIGILHSDDYFYKNALSIVARYFKENSKIDLGAVGTTSENIFHIIEPNKKFDVTQLATSNLFQYHFCNIFYHR